MLLHPNEQIIKIFRRYGLTYFWQWFLVFIFVTAPFFFMFWLFSWGKWGMGVFIASLVLAIIIFLRALFYWRKNTLVVTSERIIKTERKGVLSKNVIDLSFYNVRAVSYKIKGIFPTLLGYGKIVIDTNDNKVGVEMNKIRKPAAAVNVLAQIQQKQQKEGLKPLNFDLILNMVRVEGKDNLLKLKEAVDKRLKELV
jgi:hypothetical protein